jgi:hypothetical protein
MWLLKVLPDFVFHLLVVSGAVGVVAALCFSKIPFVSRYKTPIQIVSIAALVVGIFFEGVIYNEAKAQAQISALKVKVAEAEALSAKENVKIVEKVVYKDKIIRQRGEDNIKYVDREIVKYDSQCVIPKEFIDVVNKAAEQPK